MNFLAFSLGILVLLSFDVFIAFILYVAYKYVDFKYFSKLDITILREENNYLKKENKKVNGTSTSFWKDDSFD